MRYLIALLLLFTGCEMQSVSCGTPSRNLTIPYAYAAAYVVSDHVADTTKMVPAEKPAASDGDNAATDSIEPSDVAPPAVKPQPQITLYCVKQCPACEYTKGKLKAANVEYQEVMIGGADLLGNKDSYPYARVDGERVEYQDFLTYLEELK